MIAYIAASIIALVCDAGECPDHLGSDPYAQAQRYAEAIVDGARPYDVDPLLLLALAMGESTLNQYAVSHKGWRFGVGMLQLSPRFHAKTLQLCRTHPGHCTYYHAREAAQVLAEGKRRCGSWAGAVRRYRLGHCGSPVEQTWKVIRIWRRLQRGM